MKRIIAWVGIIILLTLYVVTLISAIISSPQSNALFWASAFSTVTVPLIMFILMRLDEYVKNRRDEFIRDAKKTSEEEEKENGRNSQ